MTSVTGMDFDAEDLWAKDRRHHIHPFSDFASSPNTNSLIIVGAEGARVIDSEGKEYIDGLGGMWCVNAGYGRKEIADAIADQACRLNYYSPFNNIGSAPAAELAAKLAELAPGDLNRVFFSNSGSDANETAWRFIQYYFNCIGQPQKKQIITRWDAYHGSTYFTASISGKKRDRTYFDYLHEGIHHLRSPLPFRRPKGTTPEQFCDLLIEEFEAKILEVGPENVGCFMSEPVLASGGVNVPPDGYQKRTYELCQKYGIIYVSDEVVTGFGRLGHFFATEALFGIKPDIITCAKGLTSGYQPLGATIISDKLFDRISGENSRENSLFSNGYTFSAHPVACAGALANIGIFEREQICEHVREIGPYFQEQLKTLLRYPIVGDVRGMGLMACVECVISEETEADEDIAVASVVDKHCQKRGLILRPMECLCILSPPLVVTKADIDQIVHILGQAIEETMEELRREWNWQPREIAS